MFFSPLPTEALHPRRQSAYRRSVQANAHVIKFPAKGGLSLFEGFILLFRLPPRNPVDNRPRRAWKAFDSLENLWLFRYWQGVSVQKNGQPGGSLQYLAVRILRQLHGVDNYVVKAA